MFLFAVFLQLVLLFFSYCFFVIPHNYNIMTISRNIFQCNCQVSVLVPAVTP